MEPQHVVQLLQAMSGESTHVECKGCGEVFAAFSGSGYRMVLPTLENTVVALAPMARIES